MCTLNGTDEVFYSAEIGVSDILVAHVASRVTPQVYTVGVAGT